jgi:hypothetical protein
MQRGSHHKPETREKMRVAWENLERRTETSVRMSEFMKARHQDPVYRALTVEHLRAARRKTSARSHSDERRES